MCDGGAIAATVATVISTAMTAYAQHESQKAQETAQKQAANYNAQVAANEEATQRELARNEIAKGVADRERQQRQALRAMGGMRAGMGASGFTMDSGSSLSLLTESAEEHQYDSQIITNNAAQAAWAHQVAATGARNNQSFAQYQAANANSGRAASLLNMGGTIIGGIAQGIGQYNKWSTPKATNTLSSVGSYRPQMEYEYDAADNLYGISTGNRYKFKK